MRAQNRYPLLQNFDDEHFAPLRNSEVIGRPFGSRDFIEKLEKRYQRTLKPQKPGPKRKLDDG